jgi:hydrogenase large subunit
MATIKIVDPVTRIEGHMKVEVTIEDVGGGQLEVTDARSTGTLFRGFETILTGRHPWDAPIITERICGVCPVSHGMAAVLALEAAGGRKAKANGRILRNLVLGADYLHSHILHFYLLAALDYVKGPQSAPWTPAWAIAPRSGLETLTPAINSSMLKAVEARRRAHEMGAVFGGRMPHPHSSIPGGSTAVPTSARVAQFKGHLDWLSSFVKNVYIPDVEQLASVYFDYKTIGDGYKNLMAYGAFDLSDTDASKLFTSGLVRAASLNSVTPLDTKSIKESVTYSWYDDTTNNLAPTSGSTQPVHPKNGAYSWLKAPRYAAEPFEAGPLARMWMTGDYRRGISVMDRHLARAYEAQKIAAVMQTWLGQIKVGGAVYDQAFSLDMPVNGSGVGLTEAPRGALGHWVTVKSGKISNYQVITPTCWNASPRDAAGVRGPIEEALIGTPIKDQNQPVEVVRVIHSFDPCLSCAVHVIRPSGKVTVLTAA